MNQEQLKKIIIDDFSKDQNNTLIGFCDCENSVYCDLYTSFAPIKLNYEAGTLLVLWIDNNSEFRINSVEEFYNDHLKNNENR